MKLILILLNITFLIPVFGQNENQELYKSLRVRKEIIRHFWNENDTTFDVSELNYDKNGFLISENKKSRNGKLFWDVTYNYDGQNRLILIIEEKNIFDKYSIDSTTFEYDSLGRVYKGYDGPYFYQNDDKGKVLYCYEPLGSDTLFTFYEYDLKDREIKLIYKNTKYSRTSHMTETSYDKKSRITFITNTYYTYYNKAPWVREHVNRVSYLYEKNGLIISCRTENIKWHEREKQKATKISYHSYEFY